MEKKALFIILQKKKKINIGKSFFLGNNKTASNGRRLKVFVVWSKIHWK